MERNTKDKILDFMTEIFETSGWPFVSVSVITNHIGHYPKKELNELFYEGKITVHDSIKGKIVKLIREDSNV